MRQREPQSIAVRRAAAPDAYPLGALLEDALHAAPSSTLEPWELPREPLGFGRHLLEAVDSAAGGLLLVAEHERAVAGAVRVAPRELRRSRHVGDVELIVHPRRRGLGLGRALLEAAERHARRERRIAVLVLRASEDDPDLGALAARCGYVIERRERAGLVVRGLAREVVWWARHLASAPGERPGA